jgi:predicted aspartyl protease
MAEVGGKSLIVMTDIIAWFRRLDEVMQTAPASLIVVTGLLRGGALRSPRNQSRPEVARAATSSSRPAHPPKRRSGP